MDTRTLSSTLWNMARIHTIRRRYGTESKHRPLALPHVPQDGVNALHIAAFKGRNKIVRYLCLTERMVVDAQDKVTTLMLQAMYFLYHLP